MKRPAAAHRSGEFIRLSQLAGGVFRPEQHMWMKQQKEFFVEARPTKTTQLRKITPPDSVEADKERVVIRCRTCGVFEKKWKTDLNKEQQTYMRRNEKAMLRHVRACETGRDPKRIESHDLASREES